MITLLIIDLLSPLGLQVIHYIGSWITTGISESPRNFGVFPILRFQQCWITQIDLDAKGAFLYPRLVRARKTTL